MIFQEFAMQHGLIVNQIKHGIWMRVPTTDKPHKRNGAYFHAGHYAVLQNHATMTECAIWKNEGGIVIAQTQKECEDIERKMKERQAAAARKAAWILHQCTYEKHAYLDKKGFGEETGLVWQKSENENILCIPMRVGRELVGVQMIDRFGDKRFLFGQRCAEAEYVIDAKGQHFICEGYATGLSLRAALSTAKIRYTIHIAFSAGNMLKIARKHKDALLIVDNDLSQTGERIARASGLRWWMSDVPGEDYNDYFLRVGKFTAVLKIKNLVYSKKPLA